MRKKWVFIFVFISLGLPGNIINAQIKVAIAPNSKLFITGKTNVGSFTCSFDVSNLDSPTTVFLEIIDNDLYFHDTDLNLKASCFDCGNKMMNNDFAKLLDAKNYPKIILELRKLVLDDFDGNDAKAHMDINIAGVKNSYIVPISLVGIKEMVIKGQLEINICDFGLQPPKKMMGLIVVDEVIQINIELKIKEYSF